MTDWRDQILREFVPGVARLTVVYDPDGLLLEQQLVDTIRQRGFQVLPFEDDIQFRFAYESECRTHWDAGGLCEVAVLVHKRPEEAGSVPYDVIYDGRAITFSLAHLFPHLSYPIVASLAPSDFDALYHAVNTFSPGQLGDNATKEFALRHVFEIAPELIKSPVDLLRMLLRRHYVRQAIPSILDLRLITALRSNDAFADWPLEEIVPDRSAFLRFLQERWAWHLDSISGVKPALEEPTSPGPRTLPFNHDDVRVYIDNYFIEGLLQPIHHPAAQELSGTWASVGLVSDPSVDADRRISKLMTTVERAIPFIDARHADWCRFAFLWAELEALLRSTAAATPHPDAEELHRRIGISFATWLDRHYAGLATLPPSPPAMVHHVPRWLSRQMDTDRRAKVAMLVIDGMSVVQWVAIRDVLHHQLASLVLEEEATFAWLPTLTSVSRQALFAGMPPLYFPDSIGSTDREPTLWERFWSSHGLSSRHVGYLRGLGKGVLEDVGSLVSRPDVRVVGLVLDTVDRIMHGMELGAAGLQSQVRQWAECGYVREILQLLARNGFLSVIVADHGNIEAIGSGRLEEGVVSEVRGERVRVYTDSALADRIASQYPEVRPNRYPGLPSNYHPVYPPNGSAFVRSGEHVVAHGGDSIEELIVPLITVRCVGGSQ